MARVYETTIRVECWKQHVCAACGSAFRYPLERTVSAESASKTTAEKRAEQAALAVIKTEVEMQPCPVCGLYQPDMVGSGRARRHVQLALLSGLVFLLLVGLFLLDVVPGQAVTWLVAVVGTVGLMLHWRVGLWDPNRDLARNRAEAQKRCQANELELLRACNPEQAAAVPNCSPSGETRLTMALLAAGILILASPELVRLALGWPLNPDWSPVVVGPSEWATLPFGESVESIKGKWRGEGQAKVENAAALGLANPWLRCETNNDQWGETVSLLDKLPIKSWRPALRVRVPARADLAGKEMRLHLSLQVTYPAKTNGLRYVNGQRSWEVETTLRLAAAGEAGNTFRQIWWLGTIGGVVWLTTAGCWLGVLQMGLRDKALPTLVTPLQEEQARPANEEAIPHSEATNQARPETEQGKAAAEEASAEHASGKSTAVTPQPPADSGVAWSVRRKG